VNQEVKEKKYSKEYQGWNSHFLLLWKYQLFQPGLAPFVDQSMEVQLVLSRTPEIAVPHPELVGMQCSITVKGQNQQLNIILRRR
jgi:hypothetical protein